MLRVGIFYSVVVVLIGSTFAFAADMRVDDVPIPGDVRIFVPRDAPETFSRFSGAWVGSWRGQLHHIFIVENIAANGEARVVYAVGDNAAFGVKGQWRRHEATISGDTLTIADTFDATYTLTPSDTLKATYRRSGIASRATLSRIDFAGLMLPNVTIAWTVPSEFLDTTLQEGGKPIRLEVVIEKPSGQGPFPLLVFNHGSTGRGTVPRLFAETVMSPEIADFFVKKGWMVAFPQRRGRGKSDGIYDEGFAPDRTQGYSCDPTRSLPGADRALDDIKAAGEALRQRPDVAAGRFLVGGVSRGGMLAIAYAGTYPEQVLGVLNFVGGWLGEGCGTAGDINGALFQRGGKFDRPTLWLYGQHDSYYSIEHSRSNFDAFRGAGGNGEFFEFAVPNGIGHGVLGYPSLWTGVVEKYLIAIGAPRAQ
jgi:pimeloyl-ACP methyl ester carboxylesterase